MNPIIKSWINRIFLISGIGCIIGLVIVFTLSPNKRTNKHTAQESNLVNGSPSQLRVSRPLTDLAQKLSNEQSNRLSSENRGNFYDSSRNDPDYLDKVRRHQQIDQYLQSSRRHDPEYRRVLVRLLEEGYDLENWLHVVATLSHHTRQLTLARNRMQEAGFSEREIEAELEPLRKQNNVRSAYIHADLKNSTGISNDSLIQELAKMELECLPNEAILGPGTISDGDRLLTNDDWLDSELRTAQESSQH